MPTIKENLLALRAAIIAYPEEQFELCSFVQELPGCGTLYCSAGLAATMPYFIRQLPDWAQAQGTHTRADSLSDNEDMWGEDPYNRLFSMAHESEYDEHVAGNPTDKQLAIARIDMALEEEP